MNGSMGAAMQKPSEIGDVSALGQRYLDGQLAQHSLSDEIRPSQQGDIPDLRSVSEEQKAKWKRAALTAVREGQVVFGLLAAGASSRMDPKNLPEQARRLIERSPDAAFPQSKALVPVVESGGEVYTFLDLFIRNVQRFAESAGAARNTLLFVSEKNEQEVIGRVKAAFANDTDLVNGIHTVVQPLEPQIIATTDEVQSRQTNFADDETWRTACEISEQFAGCELDVRKPAGHGEFLHQLVASGMASRLLSEGVRFVSVRNIDNVPALLDDAWLTLFGYMIEEDASMLVEVSERIAAQKGGALIQYNDRWRLAEDPSFAGSNHQATDSFYINNAVAIIRLDYLYPIYETNADELLEAWRAGDESKLQEIADRGRRKFPTIIEAKPVQLDSTVVGAITPETNMWESTAIAADAVRVRAFGVVSEADEAEGIDAVSADEARRRANHVRFAPVKKWDDYTDAAKQTIIEHVAERILGAPLIEL